MALPRPGSLQLLLALLSDLHANREALSATLAHADRAGASRLLFLGDYLGYGADPAWVLRTVMDRVANGAVALLGNHDEALFRRNGLQGDAATAMDWTRRQLSPDAATFLKSLPHAHAEGDILFVHADASDPPAWRYVESTEAARRSLGGTHARVTVCGHTHKPALYAETAVGKVTAFTPADEPIPLTRPRRWLAVLGAVGQPRDGDPSACYGLLDTAANTLRWVRVPYDVETAAAKVRAAGLPPRLPERLLAGR